jgi:hypothetical protein
MTDLSPELVAADLAQLINPGLRSPRTHLEVLPTLAGVQAERVGGAATEADAIEAVVNHGLAAMTAAPSTTGLPSPRAADPVKALRAALALRPGSERVKSKTRRAAAAQAMGLLSGDGWRAHHEKPLLRDLAAVICALDTATPQPASRNGLRQVAHNDPGIASFYSDFVDITDDWERLFTASSTLDLAIMYGATWRNTYRKNLAALAARPDGRIRVVLPEPRRSSPLTPHLSLHICTIPRTALAQLNAELEPLATATLPGITPTGVEPSGGGYIMLNIERTPALMDLHEAVLAAAAQARDGLDDDPYGSPYIRDSFTPHISLAKLDRDDQADAADIARHTLADVSSTPPQALELCDIGANSERWDTLASFRPNRADAGNGPAVPGQA